MATEWDKAPQKAVDSPSCYLNTEAGWTFVKDASAVGLLHCQGLNYMTTNSSMAFNACSRTESQLYLLTLVANSHEEI